MSVERLIPGLGVKLSHPANISVTRCKADLAIAQAHFQNDIQPHGRSRAHEAKAARGNEGREEIKKAIEGKEKARLMARFFRCRFRLRLGHEV